MCQGLGEKGSESVCAMWLGWVGVGYGLRCLSVLWELPGSLAGLQPPACVTELVPAVGTQRPLLPAFPRAPGAVYRGEAPPPSPGPTAGPPHTFTAQRIPS